MSIHHRLEEWELSDTSLAELYAALGERDTPRLFDQHYDIVVIHDLPTGGGSSLDRRATYLDRTLYQQCMDGEFKASGLTPHQLLYGWVLHERIEPALIVGDNPVDTYFPAHRRALAAEHEHYRGCGADPENVEEVVWPALVACYKRPIKNPPIDLWCGPILDDPDGPDEGIIEQLIAAGVNDARRRSRYSTHYGMSQHQCGHCRNFARPKAELSACIVVDGMVRDTRGCDLWLPRDDKREGLPDSGYKLTRAAVDYTDNGHAPELCDRCVHWTKDGECELVRGEIKPSGWCRLYSPSKGER